MDIVTQYNLIISSWSLIVLFENLPTLWFGKSIVYFPSSEIRKSDTNNDMSPKTFDVKSFLVRMIRTCEVNPTDGQSKVYVWSVEAATDGAGQPDGKVDGGDDLGGDDDEPEDDGNADEDLEPSLKRDYRTNRARQAYSRWRHHTFTNLASLKD